LRNGRAYTQNIIFFVICCLEWSACTLQGIARWARRRRCSDDEICQLFNYRLHYCISVIRYGRWNPLSREIGRKTTGSRWRSQYCKAIYAISVDCKLQMTKCYGNVRLRQHVCFCQFYELRIKRHSPYGIATIELLNLHDKLKWAVQNIARRCTSCPVIMHNGKINHLLFDYGFFDWNLKLLLIKNAYLFI